MNTYLRQWKQRRAKPPFTTCASSLMCVLFTVLVLSVLQSAHALDTVFDFGEPGPAFSDERQVRYSFTLQNAKNTVLEKGHLWVWAPVRETAVQWCRRINVSHPAELIVDNFGNQVLHFGIKDLAPYGVRIIRIKADLRISSKEVPAVSVSSSYLLPSSNAQSDAPEIIALARTLEAETGKKAAAKRMFHWVAVNIEYTGYHRNDRGALWALKNLKGDCSEYASLFTALCRASEIPARRLAGFICRQSAVLKPYDHHSWAEFYDGNAWQLSDPQEKRFIKGHSDYIALRILEENSGNNAMRQHRLFRVEGIGLQVRMNNK